MSDYYLWNGIFNLYLEKHQKENIVVFCNYNKFKDLCINGRSDWDLDNEIYSLDGEFICSDVDDFLDKIEKEAERIYKKCLVDYR